MFDIDRLIVSFDRGVRTLFASAHSERRVPGQDAPEPELGDAERRHAAALMRVNHTGEVCAQALYQGQALTAGRTDMRAALERAAQEETEHLAWTEHRIHELGGSKSVFNPVFYAGSFAIGAAAGVLGDRWNLGFLAETERQVVAHLDEHLGKLPEQDHKSRAILEEMRQDEARHVTFALQEGGAALPLPARALMRFASIVMKRASYWL
jgi:3-demethoxyubiquinol 3-hydroxylase